MFATHVELVNFPLNTIFTVLNTIVSATTQLRAADGPLLLYLTDAKYGSMSRSIIPQLLRFFIRTVLHRGE